MPLPNAEIGAEKRKQNKTKNPRLVRHRRDATRRKQIRARNLLLLLLLLLLPLLPTVLRYYSEIPVITNNHQMTLPRIFSLLPRSFDFNSESIRHQCRLLDQTTTKHRLDVFFLPPKERGEQELSMDNA